MRFALFILVLLLHSFSYSQIRADEPSEPDFGLESDIKAADGQTWVVETSDGNVYKGEVVEWTDEAVILRTVSLGDITIPKTEIVAIEEASRREARSDRSPSSILQGRYRHANLYSITPTGYGLKKGEWYYRNSMLFYNQINYGITDNVAAGLGAIPFPFFSPIWVTVKGSIPVVEDRLNIGVNALVGSITSVDVFGRGVIYGTVYANATFGSPNDNISAGLGYGFVQSEWSSIPTFVVAGTKQLGKKFHLISENFIVVVDGSGFGLLSIGGRAGYEKVSFDFNFYFTAGGSFIGPFVFPVLGIGVPIN